MIIGKFVYDRRVDFYWGEVSFIDYVNVRLVPVRKSKPTEPDYTVIAEGAYGTMEFGAGWKRASVHGERYVSVLLDHPAWPEAVFAALLADDDMKSFSLVWPRRERRRRAAA